MRGQVPLCTLYKQKLEWPEMEIRGQGECATRTYVLTLRK